MTATLHADLVKEAREAVRLGSARHGYCELIDRMADAIESLERQLAAADAVIADVCDQLLSDSPTHGARIDRAIARHRERMK